MDVKGHLDLLLLATLTQTGPAHGYAVIAALREHSGGAFDLPEGTVYPALHRLEQAGLIASHWDESAPRRRRVYALTAGGRRARATKGGREPLTPSERRVATLAASGHTTRQIAGELFVTAKTVEFHLRHIYRKLGIPSTRADLAAALAGNDSHATGNG